MLTGKFYNLSIFFKEAWERKSSYIVQTSVWVMGQYSPNSATVVNCASLKSNYKWKQFVCRNTLILELQKRVASSVPTHMCLTTIVKSFFFKR